MRTKELNGLCVNLAAMACSDRISLDFEVLAELPDGEIAFDLAQATATHSTAGALEMESASDLSAWLNFRLTAAGFDPQQLKIAHVLLTIDTSSPPTNRATCVSFRFHSTATLATDNRRYGADASNHVWYNRPPNKPLQSDEPSARH